LCCAINKPNIISSGEPVEKDTLGKEVSDMAARKRKAAKRKKGAKKAKRGGKKRR
jgi:hypothetical protein